MPSLSPGRRGPQVDATGSGDVDMSDVQKPEVSHGLQPQPPMATPYGSCKLTREFVQKSEGRLLDVGSEGSAGCPVVKGATGRSLKLSPGEARPAVLIEPRNAHTDTQHTHTRAPGGRAEGKGQRASFSRMTVSWLNGGLR